MIEKEGIDFVICLICQKLMKRVTNSHLKRHSLDFIKYKVKFPLAQLSSLKSREKYSLSMTGKKLSEETKKKISLKHKGKTIPKEMRLRISKKQKGRKLSRETIEKRKLFYKIHGHPSKGRKHSEKTKMLLSEAGKGRSPPNKGKPVPEEVKKKISEKLKGRHLSFETRQKMKVAKHNISLETRLKISQALKGKPKIRRNLEKKLAKPNKFEARCMSLFEANNMPLKFVGDYRAGFFIEGKIPDFVATNNKKLLIEVFCDYYKIKQYGSVENYKNKREFLFSKYGWKTLFFSDKDIKLKTKECLDIIKKELN
jgi:very-short-patch-repair endonuclease